MSENNRKILFGSIINLKNGATDGGYLDMRWWVSDKPNIGLWPDPNVRAFVSTNINVNRALGSGSWKVISAEGKKNGTPLKIGDKIHLLNMYPGAGYLDSFEWVRNIIPFKDFPMAIGVFTASVPARAGGLSGAWTVESAGGKSIGAEISECQLIQLRNGYPGAGFLRTYSKVADQLFKEHEGQQLYVFTGPKNVSAATVPTNTSPGSPTWEISLSPLLEHLHSIQHQWGDKRAPWHQGGVYKIGNRSKKRIVKLSFDSTDKGKTLTGRVRYTNASLPEKDNFKATQQERNDYNVEILEGDSWKSDGVWRLGSRESQTVTKMTLTSPDAGITLEGEVTYAGEGRVSFRGKSVENSSGDISKIWDAFLYPSFLKGRTSKIIGVIDGTYRLLSASIIDLGYQTIDSAITNASSDTADPKQTVDGHFQRDQMLNLFRLSEKLNTFFQNSVQQLIARSMEKHRLERTAPPYHLYRKCFQRVATDHELIQQATIQRRWNQDLDKQYFMSEQATELLIMDKLAIKALAPFKHLVTKNDTKLAIITYLSEKTHIHHVPYTNQLILIGVSYDRVPSARHSDDEKVLAGEEFSSFELMAIPHEVGHYIFQHAQLKGDQTFAKISEKFKGKNPYYRWCQDIFADLYGCLVAGPLTALGMKALLESIDKTRIWKDDEEHPTPLLRVFILAEMLRILPEIEDRVTQDQNTKRYRGKDGSETVVDYINKEWAKTLQKWGYERLDKGTGRPARIYLPDEPVAHLEKIVNIDRVIETINPIIIEFATHLLNNEVEMADNSVKIPWIGLEKTAPKSYHDMMLTFTKRDFASKKALQQLVPDSQVNQAPLTLTDPDEILQQYLDEWGDSGPLGGSGGTH